MTNPNEAPETHYTDEIGEECAVLEVVIRDEDHPYRKSILSRLLNRLPDFRRLRRVEAPEPGERERLAGFLREFSEWRRPTARDWENGAVRSEFDEFQSRAANLLRTEKQTPSSGERERHPLIRQILIGEYWIWQGDEDDDLDSLTCPVVIRPYVLADLLRGEPGGEAERAGRITLDLIREMPVTADDEDFGCELLDRLQAAGITRPTTPTEEQEP